MKENLRKERILAALGILAVLSAVSYLLLFGPKIKELARLKAEAAAKETELGNSIQMWGAMARSGGEETRRWEEQVVAWRERFPENPETDRLMSEIGREAVSHNLKGFRLVLPADATKEKSGAAEGPAASAPEGAEQEKPKPYGEIRLRLTFYSTYRDMAEFVDGIDGMRRVLSIRSLVVREKDGEMETSMEMSAFYRKAQ